MSDELKTKGQSVFVSCVQNEDFERANSALWSEVSL